MSIPEIAPTTKAPWQWLRFVRGNLPASLLIILAGVLPLLAFTSCANFFPHQFIQPSRDWQARNGQLLYRSPKTTLIGEVLVRFSKSGEFELTFSKGPGVTLLTLRQDATFAQIRGGLARGSWSGPIATAPTRLRGWLGLGDELRKTQNQSSVRYVAGKETFIFRF
jgi:hypothetical protein